MITQDREPIGWEHGDLQHVLDVLIYNDWWPDLLWGEWREVGDTQLIGVWVELGDLLISDFMWHVHYHLSRGVLHE